MAIVAADSTSDTGGFAGVPVFHTTYPNPWDPNTTHPQSNLK